jgi:transposase
MTNKGGRPRLRIEFSEEGIEALQYERYHHPHPRVQRQMEAVYLKSQELSHREICRLTGITGNTLRSYLGDYQAGGIEKLKELNFYRPQSELSEHRESLEAYFGEHPVSSINEARAIIAERTGIERSPTQIGQFLKRLGVKRRKVGMIPAKADVAAQAEFKKKR